MSFAANIAWLSAGALACVLGLFAWVAGVRWWFRIKAAPAERLTAVASDGWALAVFHRKAKVRRFREPVVLCHGLAANHHNLDFEPPYSLAHALNEAGFDTYAIDFRGTLNSARSPQGRLHARYTVDDHIERDGPALIELALKHSGAEKIFWVGHSLGGLVGYAVAGAAHGEKLAGLVTLGSPVFYKFDRHLIRHAVRAGLLLAWSHRFRHTFFSTAMAPFLGHFALPLSDTIVNPKHIAPRIQRQAYATVISAMGRQVLLQFRDWIWNDAFRSADKSIDYRDRVKALQVPILVAGGAQDRLAPAHGVERAFALAGSEDKTLLVFGRDNGDAQDYGHGDLIFGTGAPTEVFPVVIRWLEARATSAAA